MPDEPATLFIADGLAVVVEVPDFAMPIKNPLKRPTTAHNPAIIATIFFETEPFLCPSSDIETSESNPCSSVNLLIADDSINDVLLGEKD